MFCNCSPNVQVADSKNNFYLSHLIQLFTRSTEVNNYILYGGKELHFIYGKMLESLCMFMYNVNVQCVCTCDL